MGDQDAEGAAELAARLARARDPRRPHVDPTLPKHEDIHPHDYPGGMGSPGPWDEERKSPTLHKDSPTEAIEAAWGLIANASGGDWSKESPEWQEAAARWRDRYMIDRTNFPPAAEMQPNPASIDRRNDEARKRREGMREAGLPVFGPEPGTAEANMSARILAGAAGEQYQRDEAARVARRENDRQDPLAVRHWLRNGPRGGLQAVRFDFERWRDRLAWRYCRRLIRDAARAIVNRGYERSFLTSRSYHELHALIDRVWPNVFIDGADDADGAGIENRSAFVP